MSDLIERLREHADRTAGGGPGDVNYDPETLDIEHEAAARIRELEAERDALRALLREVQNYARDIASYPAWAASMFDRIDAYFKEPRT